MPRIQQWTIAWKPFFKREKNAFLFPLYLNWFSEIYIWENRFQIGVYILSFLFEVDRMCSASTTVEKGCKWKKTSRESKYIFEKIDFWVVWILQVFCLKQAVCAELRPEWKRGEVKENKPGCECWPLTGQQRCGNVSSEKDLKPSSIAAYVHTAIKREIYSPGRPPTASHPSRNYWKWFIAPGRPLSRWWNTANNPYH